MILKMAKHWLPHFEDNRVILPSDFWLWITNIAMKSSSTILKTFVKEEFPPRLQAGIFMKMLS